MNPPKSTGRAPVRTARRPGPRTDVDTQTVILDTAERLFGDGSVDTVSLRAVAVASGVATRAVSYHFGDRNRLLQAVIQRRLRPIAELTTARLIGLVQAPEPVDLHEVVRAVVDPYVELLDGDPVAGLRWIKILTQYSFQHKEIWDDAPDAANPGLAALFIAAVGRALPELHPMVVKRRGAIAMMSMMATLANSDLPTFGSPLGPQGLERWWLSQLIEFTTAGLRGEDGGEVARTLAPEPRPAEASGRGRPRDQRRRAAVVAATRELLLARGYDELTLTEVARRADVSRPFLYENWGTKFALVEDAIFTVADQNSLIEDGKPFERALADLIEAMVALQADPVYLAGLAGIASELYNRSDLLAQIEAKYTGPIRAVYVRLVERGKAEGIVRPDVNGGALMDTVRGAVMLHLLMRPAGEVGLAEHLRSIILPGIATH